MRDDRYYDDERQDRETSGAVRRAGSRRKKRNATLRLILAVVAVLGIASFAAIFALSCATDMLALGKTDNQTEITVEKGMSLGDISAMLGERGVVEHPTTFRLYAQMRGAANSFQAGDYVLNSNMSYDRLITALRMGNTVKEEVTVTFREGLTMREIAALLEENEVCDADEFIECAETTDFALEFENMIPENELRFRLREGYLFPDTYDFYKDENVTSVARKFFRNFQNRVMGEVYDSIQDAGMTLDEAITLASIIQKEAGDPDEMVRVSSVFHNRLDDAAAGLPMLQSDVTIFYVERDIKPYHTMTQQDIYDAYNTYVCRGLPVGPICSPGLAAITAAVNPEESDYYFFLSDSEGVYYYSETLAKHNAVKRRVSGAVHGTDAS